MTMANSSRAPACALRIEGEMSIYRAAALQQMLAAALARCTELELDLAGVTELDSAGLQVLMLAKRRALAARRGLRLVAPSPAVLEVFGLLDLADYFSDAHALPARFAGAAPDEAGT